MEARWRPFSASGPIPGRMRAGASSAGSPLDASMVSGLRGAGVTAGATGEITDAGGDTLGGARYAPSKTTTMQKARHICSLFNTRPLNIEAASVGGFVIFRRVG
jgi:hypothetical protein